MRTLPLALGIALAAAGLRAQTVETMIDGLMGDGVAAPAAPGVEPAAAAAGDTPGVLFTVNEDVPAVLQLAAERVRESCAITNETRDAIRQADVQNEIVAVTIEKAAKQLGVAVSKPPDISVPLEAGGKPTLDGLEVGRDWVCETWGDSGIVKLSGDRLHVAFTIGPNRKVALTKMLRAKLSISPTQQIAMDVENPTASPFRLALGIFIGFDYYETPARAVLPGKSEVVFDMGANNLKSEATHWLHQDSLKSTIAADKLTLLIYARKEGEAYFDNIRVEKRPTAP